MVALPVAAEVVWDACCDVLALLVDDVVAELDRVDDCADEDLEELLT